MLPAFVFGVALLAGLLLAGRWYAAADAKTLLKALKWLLLGAIASAVAFFLISGRLAWAFAVLPALLPWFYRIRALARAAKTFARMRQAYGGMGMGAGGAGAAGSSDLKTRFLRMWLDHASGVMSGEVTDGPYAGRRLDDMGMADLIGLWRHCEREDPESARVAAAYLDRVHPDWRDRQNEHASAAAGTGPMDRTRALQVLGLAEDADDADIKDAHRRLIAGMHPDHGGSDYLAAQINQAKDVLLGD